MSVGRTYEDFLRDILSAAEHARQFIQGVSYDEFEHD
jgi:uncharacterized protein with HEPN domain